MVSTRKYKTVISEAKKLSNNMRIRTSGNKSEAMWNLIKEELGNQRKMKNIEINTNGANIQDPKTISNVFNEYYTSTAQNILSGNSLSKNIEVNVNAVKYNSNSMFLTPTTEVEVVGIIKGLRNKKSTGIDDIPEYIIKKCYPKITTALTYIINLSLSTQYFPDQLKMIPLYKKGCETDVANYRSVSQICFFKSNGKNHA
jgi:CCR4-NOT transcriptional regulation complex NOT5 subunit